MNKLKVVGVCENCGEEFSTTDYKITKEGGFEVKCPACKKETQNWDTPEAPQFAPCLVQITK